jgi:cyanate permease
MLTLAAAREHPAHAFVGVLMSFRVAHPVLFTLKGFGSTADFCLAMVVIRWFSQHAARAKAL